jgi:hypothetical protein
MVKDWADEVARGIYLTANEWNPAQASLIAAALREAEARGYERGKADARDEAAWNRHQVEIAQ